MNVKRGLFVNLGLFFEDIVKNAENKIALKYNEKNISYKELNILSNRIANFLKDQGTSKQDVVGIFNTKEPVGYATMLACLKLGVIYTNVDEENPKERLKKIFSTAQPKLLISDYYPNENIKETVRETQISLHYLQEEDLLDYDDQNLQDTHEITGANPAYIMFTSGSTGTPKGVLISHASIISFVDWSSDTYDIRNNDIFAQVSPIYFDNSVFDFYTALFSGASLAPIKKETLKNPLALVQAVDQLGCTIFFSVPSLLIYLATMKVLNKEIMKSIRIFTFGGEGYPKSELKKLYETYALRARFINVYGPTEGTCICSSYEITQKDFNNLEDLPPLGKINKNFDYLILDENGKRVNMGETGELCLLGPNIGLGYYNDLERTNISFIANPLQKNYFEKIYLTGDLVHADENAILWFTGRKDNQIKHMGYRIELEEIENAINTLPFVSQSAVVYQRVHATYGKIIAFVATEDNVEENEIKKLLQDLLPVYMIPNIVEIRDYLPKNPNGKIDKVRLKNSL